MGVAIVLVVALAYFGATQTALFGFSGQTAEKPLQIGWQTAWAENGYVIEPLKNSAILTNNSLDAEFVPFVTGVSMLEPAVSNQLDVIFLGSPVAAILLSKSDDWVIVSKMVIFSNSIMAGKNSGIKDVAGLRGKKIGVPFGSGPYAMVLQALIKNGLDSKKNVTLVNLKPTDFSQALSSGSVDAVAWNPPSRETIEAAGVGYEIYSAPELGVMLVSRELVEKQPDKVKRLVQALKESEFFFAQNQSLVQEWYSKDSSLDLSLVKNISTTDPNFEAKSIDQVNPRISDSEMVPVQERFDIFFNEGVISKRVIFSEHVDQNFVE